MLILVVIRFPCG